MIKIGTDITEISRFRQMHNIELFKKNIFTLRERNYFNKLKDPYPSMAASFAAKEAFAKYMGTGFRGFRPQDVEVLHNELGKPYLLYLRKPLAVDLSLSHSKDFAVAVVCGEEHKIARYADMQKSYRSMLPKRRSTFHKGDCGRVLIIAGSNGMSGAACLCSQAAIRSGSGLVTLALPEYIQPIACAKLTEVMTLPLLCNGKVLADTAADSIDDALAACDVCAIGPGLGKSIGAKELLRKVLQNSAPAVIDADALNILSAEPDMLKDKKCDVIITPHSGEMSRLTGLSIKEIESDRSRIAADFAARNNVYTLLKGHKTVIASPDKEIHINESGNSGMASGGMGDVLAGIITSLIGQGLNMFNAAALGAFIHGFAADIAADEKSEYSLIASDVIDALPRAFKELTL